MVKRLSCLPSKQAAGVRLPFGVFSFCDPRVTNSIAGEFGQLQPLTRPYVGSLAFRSLEDPWIILQLVRPIAGTAFITSSTLLQRHNPIRWNPTRPGDPTRFMSSIFPLVSALLFSALGTVIILPLFSRSYWVSSLITSSFLFSTVIQLRAISIVGSTTWLGSCCSAIKNLGGISSLGYDKVL